MLGFRHASHFTTVSQFYDLQKSNKYSLHDPIIDKDLLSLDITPVTLQSLCVIGFLTGCTFFDRTLLKFNTCFCLKCWVFLVRAPPTVLYPKYRIELSYQSDYTNT
jgi:hypothetical protein